ncbi:MAG: tetratricopeptide repeat protein [Acetobacteraceae bacterium]|jgi:tetratricopeptide (TPR) repeat protein
MTLSPATLQALFGEAVQCLQAGRLAEAETLCRQVLAVDARHADSLHILGLIALQVRHPAAAIDLIGQAVALRNDVPAYYNNLGNALQDHGRLADAVAQYQRALALKPDYPQAHNNLGNALKAQGRLTDALAQYRHALALNPNDAAAHNNLGSALREQGSFAEAVVHCERALALRPDYAEAHNNLGLALQGENRLADAVAHYERALAHTPDSPQVHSNLGNALLAEGKPEEAIAHYRRALALQPDYVEAHNNLGLALQDQGKLDAAIAHHERALALNPNHAQAHNNLGSALEGQGRLDEALAHFERALALKPDYAQAYHNLGIVLQNLGRLAQAQQAYEQAIALAPQTVRYYRPLLDVRRVVAGDPYLAAMERLAQDMAALSNNDQHELHFALGKAYADLEQHERSFRHLVVGNALKRRSITYDESATLGFFDRIRAVFTPELMQRQQGLGDPSAVPIFIVGMPRSGTTLVEQILASHPAVHGSGERDDFMHAVESLHAPNDASPAFPEDVPALSGETLRQLGARYLAAITQAAPDAARITDKMPGNFAYAGLIHLALPNARIIHVRRDPIDTCVSCFSILFAVGQPQSYDLAELGRYYRAYAALMEHWRHVLPPGVMLDVQYEDVVADVAQQARRMVAHCGLEWDDACLAFHRTQRAVRTASAVQVRQDIYATSIGRWRRYGDLLQPLIKALGLAG